MWYYRGQPRIPTKESISTQISDYVTQNVNSCLKNFESFKDRFNFRMVGNISAETMINENDVFVKLNYPVESENKITGERTRNEFVARNIGVKLGKIYSMAADILESETRKTFFENLTMELL
ncbi:TPA: hypothetical protein HA219_02840, partial [Candidatus Woesearchaeota archaeon]|nr:hypothetical protein [Candidatus Woesearchaeota archaeon]